ncbi:hypothetical protein PR048_025623 [Dryococelus australis]|uniref:Reverse transcriptase domain-containing protein n=1 Tax=Dryococelus australis TaxID=614101 RepID=A0ABQ9GRU0_9NEOP|nr:hypothetical protein PR048_025623 [Dryococelus australis]
MDAEQVRQLPKSQQMLIEAFIQNQLQAQQQQSDTFLRSQFVRGLRDNSIRKQLLQFDKVVFNELVLKAIALESSKADSKALMQKSQNGDTSTTIDIIKVYQGKKNTNSRSTHDRLQLQSQNQHQPRYSRSKLRINYKELGIDSLCLRRGGDNHLSLDFRTNKSNLHCSGCQATGHDPDQRKDTDQLYRLYGVVSQIVSLKQEAVNGLSECYYERIRIGTKVVEFEVDSGAAYSFLPHNEYAGLNQDGKINIKASFNGTVICEQLNIVQETYNAIAEHVWIRKFGFVLRNLDTRATDVSTVKFINTIENMDQDAQMHPVLCNGNIGKISDFVVSLKLRKGAQPVFHRECDVRYALMKNVDAELDTLEAEGVLTKAETSDWGSPLVVIPKADGGVRLCVDYKNEQLQDAHYPIRKIDDILNSLQNSSFFCRLDLFKAYLNVPVYE